VIQALVFSTPTVTLKQLFTHQHHPEIPATTASKARHRIIVEAQHYLC